MSECYAHIKKWGYVNGDVFPLSVSGCRYIGGTMYETVCSERGFLNKMVCQNGYSVISRIIFATFSVAS